MSIGEVYLVSGRDCSLGAPPIKEPTMATKLFSCPVQGKLVRLHLQFLEASGIGSASVITSVDCECSAEAACPARYQTDCRCRQINEHGLAGA